MGALDRIFEWFGRRSFRTQLAAGFAALIVLMLAAGLASIVSHRRGLESVERFLQRDNRIAELSLMSSVAMMKARRNEKDFLLKVREYGYDEARSRYVTLVLSALATIRQDMHAVGKLSDDPAIQRDALTIAQVCDRYEANFLAVIELYGILGRRGVGLEGQLRTHGQAMETLLAAGAPESLMSRLMTLRRIEKNFLMRGLANYADAFDRGAVDYRERIRGAVLSTQRKQQLLQLSAAYEKTFHEYVRVTGQIETDSAAYLAAIHTLEPMLEQLHARAGGAAAATLASLYRLSVQTMWTLLAATVGALLTSLLVAVLLARSIDRLLHASVAFAGTIASGQLSTRLPAAGGNEFGVLIDSLNRMADALQLASNRQATQEIELRRLNRALRVLSECNETLVRATSEAELLQSICRHVVEIGGYRLAWVAYARGDAQRGVTLAAHAGSDLDYVEQLHVNWDDIGHKQGASVAAIGCDEALRRGLVARIALPMRTKNVVFGALSIYSEQRDAFDTDEVKVLQELADDLAYGVVSLREAIERASFQRELERHANFDTLTGLANRATLETRLTQAIADARRHGSKVATMFIDLDRFKSVNDTLGHANGDLLLIDVARRLESAVRESDTVARLGGDEFIVFLKDIESAADAASVATKIFALMAAPLRLGAREIRPGASIGISLFPEDGEDAGAVIRSADLAMYDAKSQGGNTFRFYAHDMNARLEVRFAMEADLRNALERGELLMHYQPQVSLVSGAITGAESLIRWRHPVRGMVPPGQFIRLAEETGLIVPLGEWVIDTVCAQLRAWLDAALPISRVAVNLSAHQFRQENLVARVRQALADNRLEGHYLEMEVTESAVMHNVDAAIATLGQLKLLGVSISLDDFGTGYSSLSYLKRFPIDHLKIDQSFVRDITTTPDDATICGAIIGLAHKLRLTVVAEGVETEGQVRYLQRQHCDEIQGYYFSKALPPDEFALLLMSDRRLVLPAMADDGPRTLLLVDDEPNVLNALQRTLSRDGYTILTAQNGAEAMALLAVHAVHVVISDQRMPGMSGTELMNKVKDLYPNATRIILSGYADLDSVIGAVNRGAIYRFLTKPWDDDALRDSVRVAFEHHGEPAPLAFPIQYSSGPYANHQAV